MLRERIQFFRERCHLLDLALRNIEGLLEVAPEEILETQLKEVEACMGSCPACASPSGSLAIAYPGFAAPSYVYTLQLEGDAEHAHYYYVGMTENFSKRMADHFAGNASEWTKLHRPVAIVHVMEGAKAEERSRTVEMMKRHGWRTTRGYCWTSRVMQAPPRDLI
jgi:predicted GIY-YIG superfamily endonuclease